jgi:hypothetical protein
MKTFSAAPNWNGGVSSANGIRWQSSFSDGFSQIQLLIGIPSDNLLLMLVNWPLYLIINKRRGSEMRHLTGYKDKLRCYKRVTIFPSPAGMSLTKLSLACNNRIIPCQEEFGW